MPSVGRSQALYGAEEQQTEVTSNGGLSLSFHTVLVTYCQSLQV